MRDPKFNQQRYDAATITVANAQTNRDINANEATLFNTVRQSNITRIVTDVDITVRLNSTSNSGIIITASDSPRVFDAVEIYNLYITNASGGAATIDVELYS